MATDVLEKLVKAKTFESGQYFENPGKYRVRVDRLLYKPDAFNGPTFIAETTIVAAEATDGKKLVLNPQTKELEGREVRPHKVGEQRSMVVVLNDKNDSTYGNVLGFLYQLTGLPRTYIAEHDDPQGRFKTGDELPSIDAAGIKTLTSDAQPAKGWEIDLQVFDKPQKKDKTKVFTNLKWTHVPREDKDTASA